ncbi:MAG: serine/threonine protein kinase [Verrucomicrobiales bacterium]|nr:serine/threonine protein kinase [Verrucomicrobiales bacterium]
MGLHHEVESLPPEPKRPGDFVGPYELQELIGEGGFGQVWYAERNESYFQNAAVKIIRNDRDDRDRRARFFAEQQALAVLNHPNIARFYQGGKTDQDEPYFAMEYLDGPPVTEYCEENHLDIDERIALFIEVCTAVDFCHEHGIFHRDLKPDNILVDTSSGEPRAKILDFGIAKLEDMDLDEEGTEMGTLEYSSPELIEGRYSEVDQRADVYSLGAILFELLCSLTPFDVDALRANPRDETVRIIRGGPMPTANDRFSGLSEADQKSIAGRCGLSVKSMTRILNRDLARVIEEALAPDPEDRLESAGELARRLEASVSSGSTAPNWFTQHKKSLRWAAAAGIAISLAGLTYSIASNSPVEPPAEGESLSHEVTAFETAPLHAINLENLERRLQSGVDVYHKQQLQTALEKSERILVSIESMTPNQIDPDIRNRLITKAEAFRAFCLLESGNLVESHSSSRHLLAVINKRSGRKKNAPDVLSDRAVFHVLLGDVERYRGNIETAALHYSEAVSLADRAGAIDPSTFHWASTVGLPHERLADLMLRPNLLLPTTSKTGDHHYFAIEAEKRTPAELYGTQAALLEKINSNGMNSRKAAVRLKQIAYWVDQNDPESIKRTLEEIESRLGPSLAEDSIEKRFLDLLLHENPRPGFDQRFRKPGISRQISEAEWWILRGELLQRTGEIDEAESSYATAWKHLEHLVKSFPEAPAVRHHCAVAYLRMGRHLAEIGSYPDSQVKYERNAYQMLKEIHREYPDNPFWQESFLEADERKTARKLAEQD